MVQFGWRFSSRLRAGREVCSQPFASSTDGGSGTAGRTWLPSVRSTATPNRRSSYAPPPGLVADVWLRCCPSALPDDRDYVGRAPCCRCCPRGRGLVLLLAGSVALKLSRGLRRCPVHIQRRRDHRHRRRGASRQRRPDQIQATRRRQRKLRGAVAVCEHAPQGVGTATGVGAATAPVSARQPPPVSARQLRAASAR